MPGSLPPPFSSPRGSPSLCALSRPAMEDATEMSGGAEEFAEGSKINASKNQQDDG